MSQSNESIQPQGSQPSEGTTDRQPDLRPAEERYAEFLEGYQDTSDFSDESLDASPMFGGNTPWILVRAISRVLRRRG